VLEGKTQYVEFNGNLIPVTKSGDQLQLGFHAFKENRLPFTVRVKDPHADTVGRVLFMREQKVVYHVILKYKTSLKIIKNKKCSIILETFY
jgi:hypothetical protein